MRLFIIAAAMAVALATPLMAQPTSAQGPNGTPKPLDSGISTQMGNSTGLGQPDGRDNSMARNRMNCDDSARSAAAMSPPGTAPRRGTAAGTTGAPPYGSEATGVRPNSNGG
ncbi:MAG: hypothetical protein JWM91_1244 [Rhodospirillales bacterium]|nr:hypothetical protein [Rhodospirillales bacterium]